MADSNITIIGLFFIILLVAFAFIIPDYISAQNPQQENSINQDLDQAFTIGNGLEARVTDINTTSNETTILILHTIHGETIEIANLSESSSETATSDHGNVTVTNNGIISSTEVSLTYEYPQYHGYPDGVEFILSNIELLLLALFTFLIILLFRGGTNG